MIPLVGQKMNQAAKIKEILDQEGAVLQASVARALATYSRDNSTENSRRLREAKRSLAEYNKQINQTSQSASPQQFKNRRSAHEFLLRRGHELPYTTFVDACKAGKCPVEADRKTILLSSLIGYIDNHLTKGARGTEALADEKARLEVEELRERVLKRQLENRREDDRWMLKDEAWAQMAALVGTLRDCLRHHFHLGQTRLTHLAGADPSRGPELYEGIEEILARAFNEMVASRRVDVMFDGEEE